ncbi:hypothetical protein GH714_017990 [Hevea brasiliensis]|uniref:Fungal lipase-type domain-containing protein n=1 Tax=Hevea brasiliensis TaxID=3981 RepID=A0A6A6LHD9_HEVBR|nr:hypothetical protein GH714_017990 [Hevea brasiliensis]
MATPSPRFMLVNPFKGRKRDIFMCLVANNTSSGEKFLESSEEGISGGAADDLRWILLVSVIIRRILAIINTPLKFLGCLVDFFLNLLSQNGGFSGIISNSLQGKLMIPRRGTENFVSSIGQLDGRIDLYKTVSLAEKVDDYVSADANIRSDLGNRYLMDLCIMASKLVYENEKVVQNVVERPKSGKNSYRFLEAMGLGTRRDATSFFNHLRRKQTDFFDLNQESETKMMEWGKKSAYYAVAMKLKSLLSEHKNAKFVVTGHSLGGALAILFPCVLVIQEETEIISRLLNIYTFGQPRIGDEKLGMFMEAHLNYPGTRYYRVVYCNDMVPRVPFDDKVFAFKHFGVCLYYDSNYFGQFMDEEPNKNFFDLMNFIPMRLNALWEIFRSFVISHAFGPEYRESWFCTFFRVMGLVLPGIAAHSPIDYVNSVRLGRERRTPFSSLKSFARKS